MNPFEPHPDNEDPIDALDQWSLANWMTVHPLFRKDCEDYLLSKVPQEIFAHWRSQHRRGKSIGSDDPRFHHGVGMAIRNTLRDQLTDAELPEVTLDPEGKPYSAAGRNWDDYYQGVLMSICSCPCDDFSCTGCSR
jgi:hypothetical protein